MRETLRIYRFTSAAGLSLLLHIALAIALASAPPIKPPDRGETQVALVWDSPAPIQSVQPPPPPPPTPKLEPVPPPPSPPPEPRPLMLGLEESASEDAQAWLGFLDPTEHQAKLSTTEQPELVTSPATPPTPPPDTSPRPAADAAPLPPTQTPPASRPPAPDQSAPTQDAAPVPDAIVNDPQRQAPAAEGTKDGKTAAAPGKEIKPPGTPTGEPDAPPPASKPDVPPTPPTPTPLPRPTEDPGDPPIPPQPKGDPDTPKDTPPRDPALGEPDGASNPQPADTEKSKTTLGPDATTPAPPTATPSQTPSPQTAPSPASQPAPAQPTEPSPQGIVDDRESGATALTKPLEIRPGRTLAVKGQIEVKTRRPVFSNLTRLTRMPGNVVIRVEFNAAGQVVRHHWVRPSGYPDVDEPIADAVYRFRASGPAIRALAQGAAPAAAPAPAKPTLGSPTSPDAQNAPPERTLSLTFNIVLGG